MPLYLFECDKGHHSEMVRPMKYAGQPIACEGCGYEKVARQIIAPCNGIVKGGTLGKPLDYRASLGRTFESVKELDEYTQARGLEIGTKKDWENVNPSGHTTPVKPKELTMDDVRKGVKEATGQSLESLVSPDEAALGDE